MKRKILALLCVCAMILPVLASCGKKNEEQAQEQCTHTFSEAWSSDATNHWHAATCEHGEIKDSLAPHSDANEDGKCDVCEYEIGHSHTYSKDWSFDETNHWHAATCTHTTEKSDDALHKDDDKNLECDVCASHVHSANESGYCVGCDKQVVVIDPNSPEALIAAILAQSGKILNGKVDFNEVIRGQSSESTRTHSFEYIFATDGIYTKRTENEIAVEGNTASLTGNKLITEIWMKQLSAEDVTAILVESVNGKVTNAEPVSKGVDDLLGYYFPVSTLASEYGAETILGALFELYQERVASNQNPVTNREFTPKWEIDEANKTVKFTFNILVINTDTAEGEDDGADYYEVEVSFGYSADFALTSLNIKCDCYTNTLANAAEHDYTYDQQTKLITMKDTATADTYTFTVTQAVGTRAAIDMTSADPYKPTDVQIYEDAACTKVATSIEVALVDKMIELYVGCMPEGTFISFVKNELDIVVDKTGLTVVLVGDVIQVLPQIAGNYTVTFTYGGNVKTVAVSVTTNEIITDHKFDVFVSRENTYSWNLAYYDFTAPESGSYTFFLPVGLGALDKEAVEMDSNTIPFFDPNTSNDPSGVFTVDIAAGDTFSFYIFAPAEGTYSIGYNFVAKDVQPDEDEDEGGADAPVAAPLTTGSNSVKFTAEEIAANTANRTFTATVSGKYHVTDSGVFWNFKDENGTAIAKVDYAYVVLEAGKTYTVEFGMFSMFGITAGKVYTLTIELPSTEDGGDDNTGDDNTDPPAIEIPTAELTVGENAITVTADDIAAESLAYKLVITEAADYAFTFGSEHLIAHIYSTDNTRLGISEAYLEAGTYVVYVITAYITEAGDYTLTIAKKTEGDLGNQSNPIVLESIPTEPIVHNGKHDLYYTYTATEDCTIAIAFGTTGAGVSDYTYVGDYFNDYVAHVFYFYLKANETAYINLWSENAEAEHTYTFTVSAYVEEGDFGKPLEFYTGDQFVCEYPGGNDVEKFVWYKTSVYEGGTFVITFADRVNAKYSKDGQTFVTITEATTEIPVASGEVLYLAIQSSNLLEATITFETSFIELPGTQNNPIVAVVGNTTDALAGNWESKWYKFVAPAKGTFTLTYNAEGAYVYGATSVWGTEPISGPVSLEMSSGDVYYVYFESEAAVAIAFTIAFEEAAAVELNGELKATITLETPGNMKYTGWEQGAFTATEGGSYYVVVEGMDSTTWFQYDDSGTATRIKDNPYIFTLEAGQTIQFRLFGWDATVAGNIVTLKLYYQGAA